MTKLFVGRHIADIYDSHQPFIMGGNQGFDASIEVMAIKHYSNFNLKFVFTFKTSTKMIKLMPNVDVFKVPSKNLFSNLK